MEMFLIKIKNILLYCSIIFIFSNLLGKVRISHQTQKNAYVSD